MVRYVPILLIVLAGGYLYAISRTDAPTSEVEEQRAAEYASEQESVVLARNLSVPWALAFLSDGSRLVTERTGSLARVTDAGVTERIAVPDVQIGGEGGLLGLALHPRFTENRLLYLYVTHETDTGTQNRVVRYRYAAGALTDEVVVLDGIPGARYHDGGRIAFGPDGYLYVTTGDAGTEANAQSRDSLAGKILRITDDGGVPADNPFGTVVYSYGHRNPQGLAWDASGQLWSTEHGRSGLWSGYDELNRIVPGGNYGWPEVQGDEERDGMISPVVHSGSDTTWAPASLAYRDGTLYWGGLRGEALYAARVEGDGVRGVEAHFERVYGRLREVAVGPDDQLYLTTSNTDGRGRARDGDDRVMTFSPGAF